MSREQHFEFLKNLKTNYTQKEEFIRLDLTTDLINLIENPNSFLNTYQHSDVIKYKIKNDKLECVLLDRSKLKHDYEYLEFEDQAPFPEPQTAYEALDESIQNSTDQDIHNVLDYFDQTSYHDLRFNFKDETYLKVNVNKNLSFALYQNGKKTLLVVFKILLSNAGQWHNFEDLKEADLYSLKSMNDLVIALRKNCFTKLNISDHINKNADWLEYDRENERIRLIPDK